LNKLALSLLCLFWLSPAYAAERILALAPHVCESLFAIGAADQVVGVVDYCDFPEEAKSKAQLGAFHHLNIESVLALKPTLAITMDANHPHMQALRDMGVKVVQSAPSTVAGVLQDILVLGDLTGHVAEAKGLVTDLQQQLAGIKAETSGLSVPVFYEIWHEPLYTAGGQTFIHDVLKTMGLKNVFGDIPLEAPRINVESVLAAKPAIVVVPTENRDVAARELFWKQWLGDDVMVLRANPDLLHRPGPRLVQGMRSLLKQWQEKTAMHATAKVM